MISLPNPIRPVLLAAARSERIERLLSRSRITRPLVARFVPGAAEDVAIVAVKALLDSGRAISVDYLGEDISHPSEAEQTVSAYLSLLEAYRRLALLDTPGAKRLEVSIKLSALGQSLADGEELALTNARRICAAADEVGAWVNVDAEDHTTTDSTLRIVGRLRADHPSVATVLQAYLHRTADDCRALSGEGSRIRLCKGAYKEPAEVAYQGKKAVNEAYLRCLEILMKGDGYPMVASHDPVIVDAAQSLAAQTNRGTDDYEIQMLYGIRDDEQRRLVGEGITVRTYVPFGNDWYGYFMRRLAERPANTLFFLRALVGRK